MADNDAAKFMMALAQSTANQEPAEDALGKLNKRLAAIDKGLIDPLTSQMTKQLLMMERAALTSKAARLVSGPRSQPVTPLAAAVAPSAAGVAQLLAPQAAPTQPAPLGPSSPAGLAGGFGG